MAFSLADPELVQQFRPFLAVAAAGSSGSDAFIYTYRAGDQLPAPSRLRGHNEAVLCVAFSPVISASSSYRLLATSSRDQSVRIWKAITKTSIAKRGAVTEADSLSVLKQAHNAPVRWVDFSHDGQNIVTSGDDKAVKLWSLPRGQFLRASGKIHNNWVRCAKFSPDGTFVASCSDDKSIKVLDCRTMEAVASFSDPRGFAHHLSFHPGGNCIGVGTSDKKVKVYDFRMNKLQQVYESHKSAVMQVAFHPSGSYLFSCSQDGTVKLFDLLEARPIYEVTGHEDQVLALALSPDGDHFLSGGNDGKINLWQTNIEKYNRPSLSSDVQISRRVEPAEAKRPTTTSKPVLSSRKASGAIEDSIAAPTSKIIKERNNIISNNYESLENENKQLREENSGLHDRVEHLEANLGVVTETLILLEKRLGLLEDQVRYESSVDAGQST